MGVRVPAENAPTRCPAALLRPPYSYSAQKVVLRPINVDLRKPAEVGQNHLFLQFSILKLGTKSLEIEFLKFPSFKFKNINSIVYLLPILASHATPIPTNLKEYFDALVEQCALENFLKMTFLE